MMRFSSILVVCVGNICRSPTGEALLKERLPTINLASAGIRALVGHSADAHAVLAADKNGVSLREHVAQQLTAELCREYDLILVMEKKHIDAVSHIAPEVRGKTMLFGHWLNKTEIDDPYRKSQEAFDRTFQILHRSADKWVQLLTS